MQEEDEVSAEPIPQGERPSLRQVMEDGAQHAEALEQLWLPLLRSSNDSPDVSKASARIKEREQRRTSGSSAASASYGGQPGQDSLSADEDTEEDVGYVDLEVTVNWISAHYMSSSCALTVVLVSCL